MAGTLNSGRSDEGQGDALTDKLQESSPQSHAHDANADNDCKPAEVPFFLADDGVSCVILTQSLRFMSATFGLLADDTCIEVQYE